MAQEVWSQNELSLQERTYGVKSRIRRFRWEYSVGKPLRRWFPRSFFTDPLALVDICSPWEVAWVTRYMATEFTGSGAVVELGPFLGDITIGILKGLRQNSTVHSATIDSYDLFVFEDIEDRTAELPLSGRFHNGESFLPLYKSRLGRDRGLVTAHQGDVSDESWDAGRPIEFLFNDVAKTWDIWNHLKSTFYRSLQVAGTVVEQDWAHACTPWLHLWHHRYRKHFEVLAQVPHSGSVPFRLLSPLPQSAFEADQLSDYSQDEVTEAFAWAAALVDSARERNVRGAYVHLYTLHGDLDRASRLCIEELVGVPYDNELVQVALPELAIRLNDRSLQAAKEAESLAAEGNGSE